jgi:GNAT superfamily N-acetyltransferase
MLARAPEVELWIAQSDGQALGYAGLGCARDDHPIKGSEEPYALYVRPSLWHQGIGRRLHDHALARFGERGVELATLWVLEINDRARAFYEALGWENTDQRSELQFAAQTEPIHQYTRQVALARRARSRKGSRPGVR